MNEANDTPTAAGQRRVYDDYYGDSERNRDDTDTSQENKRLRPSAHADVREREVRRGAINNKQPVVVHRQKQVQEQEDLDKSAEQKGARPRSMLPQQSGPAQSFLGTLFGDHSDDLD